jgi:hypothetical protein
MTHFKINTGFAISLSNEISFCEQSIDEIYMNTSQNFLYECRFHGYDKKVELVKILVENKRTILTMLKEFNMSVFKADKTTKKMCDEKVIDGNLAINILNKSKWNMAHIFTVLISWREILQEFIELEPEDWKSNERVYIETQNNLKRGYDDLNKICRAFVVYDIYSQMLKQV